MARISKIFGKGNTDFNYEQIVEIIQNNNLTTHKKYIKFCIDNNGKFDNKQLPRNPWEISQNEITCIEFFNLIFPNKKKTKNYIKKKRLSLEEHIDLIKSNNLFTIKQYHEFYTINKKNISGLYSNPWDKFNMTAWDFLDLCIPNRDQVKKDNKQHEISQEEILKTIESENLYSSRRYRKFYLENKESIPLPSRPWDRFNMKESEFFDHYFPKRIKISSLEEITKIFKENKITSERLFKEYIAKNNDCNIQISFYKSNNMKFSEFLDFVWGNDREKHRNVMPINDFIQVLRDNKIFSFNQYRKFYFSNKEVHNNLPSTPMISYKISQPELFKMAFPDCSKLPKGRLHFKTKRKDVLLFLSKNNIENIFQYKEIEKEYPIIKDLLKTNDSNINEILQEVASVKE